MTEEIVVARFATSGQVEIAIGTLRALGVDPSRVSVIATDNPLSEAGRAAALRCALAWRSRIRTAVLDAGPVLGRMQDRLAAWDDAGLPWARLWCLLGPSALLPGELISFVVLGFLVRALAKHIRRFREGRLLTPIGEALLGLGIPLNATRGLEEDLLADRTLLLVRCDIGQWPIATGALQACGAGRLERHPLWLERTRALRLVVSRKSDPPRVPATRRRV
jgi:hypothetical protein